MIKWLKVPKIVKIPDGDVAGFIITCHCGQEIKFVERKGDTSEFFIRCIQCKRHYKGDTEQLTGSAQDLAAKLSKNSQEKDG